MSAVAPTVPAGRTSSAPGELERIWRVVRLHYANRTNSLVIPWGIAGTIFGINLVIFGLIAYSSHGSVDLASNGNQYSGALSYILPYQVVFAVQSMNLTFPFALGLSSTRRDYYLGTALLYLMQAAQFTIGFTVLSYVEQWTHGWGLGGHVFQSVFYGSGSLGERLVVFFCPILFVLFAGSIAAAVFVRWRATGLYALGLGFAVVMLGVIALITFGNGWSAVGNWFVAVGPLGLSTWLLLPTAIFAVLGFFTLRRATPKS